MLIRKCVRITAKWYTREAGLRNSILLFFPETRGGEKSFRGLSNNCKGNMRKKWSSIPKQSRYRPGKRTVSNNVISTVGYDWIKICQRMWIEVIREALWLLIKWLTKRFTPIIDYEHGILCGQIRKLLLHAYIFKGRTRDQICTQFPYSWGACLKPDFCTLCILTVSQTPANVNTKHATNEFHVIVSQFMLVGAFRAINLLTWRQVYIQCTDVMGRAMQSHEMWDQTCAKLWAKCQATLLQPHPPDMLKHGSEQSGFPNECWLLQSPISGTQVEGGC